MRLLRKYCNCPLSSYFSQFATTTAATEFPITFVSALHSLMNLSIPSTKSVHFMVLVKNFFWYIPRYLQSGYYLISSGMIISPIFPFLRFEFKMNTKNWNLDGEFNKMKLPIHVNVQPLILNILI